MIQRRNSDLDIEERFTRDINRLPEKDLDQISRAYRQLLESIGEDSNREGLRRTPDRAARAFEFLTQGYRQDRSEEHTSELQSHSDLVCRLLLEKKK